MRFVLAPLSASLLASKVRHPQTSKSNAREQKGEDKSGPTALGLPNPGLAPGPGRFLTPAPFARPFFVF
jgi:hypothetical protein